MNSENITENTEELSEDSSSNEPLPLYKIKAKVKSLDGDLRSLHFKNSISYQEVCKRVAQQNSHLFKAEIQTCVELFLTEVVRTIVEDGTSVRIDKFGIFQAKPKKPKLIYVPVLGEKRWIKAGAKFSFVPSRNLADYFREHGRRIYYRTKQREDEIKRIRSERYELKNQIAEQGGWNKPLVYLPIEELKENTLRQYEIEGKLQARIALDRELKGLAEEATKDQKSLDNTQDET